MKDRDLEKKRTFWRGDRIEWILARAFAVVFQGNQRRAGAVARTRITRAA
jgi:hypothetical protein